MRTPVFTGNCPALVTPFDQNGNINYDAFGKLIDAQIAAGVEGATYNYTIPMLLFASLGVLALLFALWLKADDKRNHYGLEEPNIK